MWRLLATIGTLVFPAQTLAVTSYSTTVLPTGKLHVILNVTDGVTTTATRLLLGGHPYVARGLADRIRLSNDSG